MTARPICPLCGGVRPADLATCLPCILVNQLACGDGVPLEREVRFAPPRRWRFDLLLPNKLAVEVDGATWVRGRHTSGSGYEKDCEKLNAAAILGYRVIRVTRNMVLNGKAAETVRAALGAGRGRWHATANTA